jgi:hypothetical protein
MGSERGGRTCCRSPQGEDPSSRKPHPKLKLDRTRNPQRACKSCVPKQDTCMCLPSSGQVRSGSARSYPNWRTYADRGRARVAVRAGGLDAWTSRSRHGGSHDACLARPSPSVPRRPCHGRAHGNGMRAPTPRPFVAGVSQNRAACT